MDNAQAYNVRKKINDKWTTVGNVGKNKYDQYQLGLRCTPALKKLISEMTDDAWVNFSLFPKSDEAKFPADDRADVNQPSPTLDDKIPF